MPEVPKTPDQRVIDGSVAAQAKSATVTNRPAPLVEDTTVVGGVDRVTGQPVIRPRAPDGTAGPQTESTDPSERR